LVPHLCPAWGRAPPELPAMSSRPAKKLRRDPAAGALTLQEWEPYEKWWHRNIYVPPALEQMITAAARDPQMITAAARGEFSSIGECLRDKGYVCLRKLVAWSNPDYLMRFDKETKRVGHIGAENKRKISTLEDNLLQSASAKVLAALDAYNLTGRRRLRDPLVMLESLPGCKQQRPPHWDFDQPLLADMDDDEIPLSVVVALEAGTSFHIYPPGQALDGDGVVISMNAGDMLIFRGDLLHAGAGYAVRNRRLHLYLDHHDDLVAPRCRQPNTTYRPKTPFAP